MRRLVDRWPLRPLSQGNSLCLREICEFSGKETDRRADDGYVSSTVLPPTDTTIGVTETSKEWHRSRLAAPIAGVLSAIGGLAMGELWSGAIGGASPIVAVGDRVIDEAPHWLKQFAIDTFGTNDKTALVLGILALTLVYAAFVGRAAAKKFSSGIVGVLGFAIVGTVAALGGRTPSTKDVMPIVAAALVVIGLLALFLRTRTISSSSGQLNRRRFLTLSGGVAVGSVFLGTLGRRLQGDPKADAVRKSIVIPSSDTSVIANSTSGTPTTVVATTTTLPVDTFAVRGASTFYSSNDDYYRIDTALNVPHINADKWSMTISGLIDKPLTLTYKDLLARPLIEHDCTLMCVSNEVGGNLIGNARWTGVRLADILREVGVKPGADQVFASSVEGFTAGFPLSVAMDGREALIAIAMNGEPLPFLHGFPARLVVPGIYGYVSAVKWLSDIKLTTFEADQGYWIPRGWSMIAPIKTGSRIDVPSSAHPPSLGMTPIAGVAWNQHVGISKVEVQIDGGGWQLAELADAGSLDTWKQWKLMWDAKPGEHTITVRATDANGVTQTDLVQRPDPDGATGLHGISFSL